LQHSIGDLSTRTFKLSTGFQVDMDMLPLL